LNSNKKAVLIFVFLAFVWGSSFILMKRGLLAFTPLQVGALRIVLAFLFMAAISWKSIRLLTRDNLKPLLVVGLLGNGFPYLLFPLAVSKIDSALAGILNALVPLFTLLVGILFFSSRLRVLQVIGVLTGLAGAVYLLLPSYGQGGGTHLLFAALPIVASMMYAFSINTLKAYLAEMKSVPLTFLALMLAAIPCVFYLIFSDFGYRLTTHPAALESLGYIAILGVVGSALAIILFNYLIKISSALLSASVTYLIPVVAIFWGWLDDEPIGWAHLIGVGLILMGIYLVNKKPKA
jgi:drug/metabolite transporter (DMT)-like permease